MRGFIVFIERALLTWLLLAASTVSFDSWLVLASAFSGHMGGDIRWGIPYACYVREHVEPGWGDAAPLPATGDLDPEALLVNLAVMGALALATTIFWPSRSPSVPSTPSPIGGSTPSVEVARDDDPSVEALDRRSLRCLQLTVVGSLLGFGWVFGALGWLRGRGLSTTYVRHGRRPRWTAAAAWAVGRGLVCAALVGILGLLSTR